MELDLDAIRDAFLGETEEDLRIVEASLLALEKTPADAEHVATVFRKFHTLKGNAAALGLDRLSGFAHHVEDLLDGLRGGRARVSADVITYLLEVVDAVRGVMPAAAAGRDEVTSTAEALQARLEGGRLSPAVGPARPEQPLHEGELPAEASRTLRVDLGRLDALLSVTSEIAIARGRLEALVREQATPEMATAYRALERLLAELHRSVSRVRMVQLAPLLRQFGRVVRDLAVEQGKQAELVVEDGGVEADNSVIEQLRAPLTHMVRNALDHGLELPAERQVRGKNPVGRVWLRARQEGSEVVIEVEDDGGGLDRGRIQARARALGVDTERLGSERELDRLIFSQGLSTAAAVTGTSGRGVGLDVVLRHVDALGGSVEVESTPGVGTRFTLRMPVTLAVVEGLVARVADTAVVIPIAGVVRCVDLPPEAIVGRGDGVLNVDGRVVPFARLRALFGLDEAEARERRNGIAVVLEKGEQQLALAVDQLVGRAQVVVKPAGRFFRGLPAVSGLTILGDGRVAPVLNVAGVVQQHVRRAAARSAVAEAGA